MRMVAVAAERRGRRVVAVARRLRAAGNECSPRRRAASWVHGDGSTKGRGGCSAPRRGERENVSDGVAAESEGDESVEPERVAHSGRHAFFERREDRRVDGIDGQPTRRTIPMVTFESRTLLARIGEFDEAVRQLDPAHEQLEAERD